MSTYPKPHNIPSAAAFCGVSARTIRRWISSGVLRAAKIGGTVRITESALREVLEADSASPAARQAKRRQRVSADDAALIAKHLK